MSSISIEKVSYKGFDQAVKLSNGQYDLVVLTQFGPRILFYGTSGGKNQLCNVEEQMGQSSDQWLIYGGHRLWHSPEDDRRTYEPENIPVTWEPIDNGIRTMQEMEPWTQLQKRMDIKMDAVTGKVTIKHRITNLGAWAVEFSIWGLTVMAPGGLEILPQPQRQTGLTHNRLLSLWPYAKMNDPRVTWGDKYIFLRQDKHAEGTFKLGLTDEDGWAAYFNHDQLFMLRYDHQMDADYPDGGVSYETYTNDFMLEMETLSPLKRVATGEYIEHVETWALYDNVKKPALDEAAVEKALAPYL